MSFRDMDDRTLTVAVWILCGAITAVDLIAVLTGVAPGLGPDRHPPEYLVASNVAIFLLISVVPALRLCGIVRMPWWFNFLLIFDVYMYVVSLTCGMYIDPSTGTWWGFIGHMCSSVSVSAICFLALCIVVRHASVNVTYGSTSGLLLFLFFITVAFGGIWEVMEGFVDMITGTAYMSYGVLDSLQDMQADTIGAFVMCAIAAFLLRDSTPEEIADSTEIRIRHR